MHGAVTVVPCSTDPQIGNQWAIELQTEFSGKKGWAICDKPCTVAVSRLTIDRSGIVRVSEGEFDAVIAKVLEWLPTPKNLQK